MSNLDGARVKSRTTHTHAEVLKLINEDPIAGGKAAREKYGGVRLNRWESAVEGYALAQSLQKKQKLSDFYEDRFWSGGYERNPAKILSHACQYIYDDRIGHESKCAEAHAAAMSRCLEQNKTPAQVFTMLKKGGFDGLRKSSKRLTKSPDAIGTAIENNASYTEPKPLQPAKKDVQPLTKHEYQHSPAPAEQLEDIIRQALPVAMSSEDMLAIKQEVNAVIYIKKIINPKSKHILFEATKIIP